MSCIENINKIIVPNDVLNTLTSVYKYIGRNEQYEKIANSDYKNILNQTIERDVFFLSKLIELDVSDNRLRLIIMKNSQPRNRDEKVLYNIKEVLISFHDNPKKFGLSSTELYNMINYIFPSQNIKYVDKKEKKISAYYQTDNVSKRKEIDNLNEVNVSDSEKIILALNYFIDIWVIKPLNSYNDSMAYLVLYLMLLKSDVRALDYVSLFEYIYLNKNEFDNSIKGAIYNWNEGLAQIMVFVRSMMNIILQMYEKTDKVMQAYAVEVNAPKGDNIENSILNILPNIFTKDDIRAIHPFVSESTINRTLVKLRDEGIIKPIGKGRSAKWLKIGLK